MNIPQLQDIDQLKGFLWSKCEVQILKEGLVFTALLTKSPKGKSLSNLDHWMEIFGAITKYTKDKYPVVECLKNEPEFALIVFKRKENEK